MINRPKNKRAGVRNSSSQTLGQDLYDGDGRRVKKYNTSTSDDTIFIYDASGILAEEYPASTPTTVSTSYVYAGSHLLSTETSSATNYLTADMLGSPRINTNGSGSVTAQELELRNANPNFREPARDSKMLDTASFACDTRSRSRNWRKRNVVRQLDQGTSSCSFCSFYYSFIYSVGSDNYQYPKDP